MRKVYIYALRCPINGLVMYIGKSLNYDFRLQQHVQEGRTYGSRNAKLKWLNLLSENGLEPTIEVIEICNESNYREIEAKWISHYADENPLLTNRQGNPLTDWSKPKKERVTTIIRLPPALHTWLCDVAKREHRSLNEQIVYLLEQVLQHRAP